MCEGGGEDAGAGVVEGEGKGAGEGVREGGGGREGEREGGRGGAGAGEGRGLALFRDDSAFLMARPLGLPKRIAIRLRHPP